MKKIIIKISTPPWSNIGQNNELIVKLIPSNLSDRFIFIIDDKIDICDYWFVFEGVSFNESVLVRKNIIFYTTEEKEIRTYDLKKLKYFDYILTSRSDILSSKLKTISTHYFNSWFIEKNYDELYASIANYKSKTLSTITSNMNKTILHNKRREIIQQLGHVLKSDIEIFGRGIREIKDKADGLNDFKFSIAIENSCIPNYFTEKIVDCFLTNTIPIYYGCPNIGDFFDINSMILIEDINDVDLIIKLVKDSISDESLYNSKLPYVIEAKKKYLLNFSPIQVITNKIDILEMDDGLNQKPRRFEILENTVFHYIKINKKNPIKRKLKLIYDSSYKAISTIIK